MTSEEWAQYLAAGRARLEALRADLAAGVDEVTAAHRRGFATRGDVEGFLARPNRNEEPASQSHPTKGASPCPTGT